MPRTLRSSTIAVRMMAASRMTVRIASLRCKARWMQPLEPAQQSCASTSNTIRRRRSHDVAQPDRQGSISRHDLDERFTDVKKSYSRSATTVDRGSDVHEERSTLAAGALARVSIAVIVDARRSLDVDKIREVAAAAGGYDPRRGDTLSVEAVAFDRPYGVSPQPFAYALGVLGGAIPGVALAAMVIVIVRVAGRPAFALLNDTARRMRLERETPAGVLSPARNLRTLARGAGACRGRDRCAPTLAACNCCAGAVPD